MGKVFFDLRYSLRRLRTTPAFTLTVILTLGLGVGVNTVMFSVIDQVLLRRLPFPDAQQLVKIGPQQGNRGFGPASLPDVEDWKARVHSLTDLAFWATQVPTLGGVKNPQLVAQVTASVNLFSVLGVQPSLGRGFSPEDGIPGQGSVVVLSNSVWHKIFNGDPGILGREVTVNGVAFTVIGVMPPSFEFPVNQGPQIFTPMAATAVSGVHDRDSAILESVGRIRPGASLAQVRQEMAGIHQRATRARLAEQSLVESLLLSLLGGAAGLVIAWAALHALAHYLADALPWGERIHINSAACGYLLVASCLSAIVFGLVPALYASQVPVQEGLREDSMATGTSKKQARWRDALVVGEIALTLTLLIAGGLMLQRLWQLHHTNLGFAPKNVVTTSIMMPTYGAWWSDANAKGPNLVTAFYNPLIEKLENTLGIESVGLASILPFSSTHFELAIRPADEPRPAKKDEEDAAPRASTTGYFRTMGIGLVSGRYFSDIDRAGTPLAVLVNEEFVRSIFHGESAVGRQVTWADDNKAITGTVVGVIHDIHQNSASEPPAPEIYFDLEQLVPGEDMYQILTTFHMDVAARTHLAATVALDAIRNSIHELRPDLALQQQTTMQQIVDDSLGSQMLATRLLAIFAVAAMVIAITGIYGLLAYSVSQRTRELGLRLALGAQRNDLLWMVLRHAFVLLGIGLTGGLGIAWAASGWMRSTVYGFPAFDESTVFLVVLLLTIFGLIASYLPARRAANVDPIEALRTG